MHSISIIRSVKSWLFEGADLSCPSVCVKINKIYLEGVGAVVMSLGWGH